MSLKGEIEELTCKADLVFKSKWEVLCFLKEPKENPNMAKSIIDFQIDLAEILVDIEKFRQKLLAEEKRLKGNMRKYKKEWFIARMKTLAHYRKVLLKLNIIGKSIGDAFVFWFYRFDLELLNEHFNHKRIIYPPLGIGGTGELEFVRNIRMIDNKIGIYHGITNILRIGDVSFFDFEKLNIVSIGEIKTKKTGAKTISIDLLILGPKNRKMFKEVDHRNLEPSKMDYFHTDRLHRQIKSMDKALKVYNPSSKHLKIKQNIEEEFNCSYIEKLYSESSSRKLSFVQASEGLFYTGIKTKYKDPITKYFKSKKYKPSETDNQNVTDYMLRITKQTSTQNSIILGQLQYERDNLDNSIRGSVPLFWMPISNQILKDIYFEDFEIMSVFNPVYLIEKLTAKGVIIKSKYCNNKIPVENIGYPKITAMFFDLYIPYILYFLQTERSIIKIFDAVKKEFSNKEKMGSVKLEIRMQQKIEKYMTKPSP